MSETAPGSYALPKHFWTTLTVALAAAVCWVLLVVFVVADITDDFPRGLTILMGTLAGVATFGLAWLRQGHLARARHAEVVDGVGGLVAEVEQLSVRVAELGGAVAVLRQQRESDRQESDEKIAAALAAAEEWLRGQVEEVMKTGFDAGRRFAEVANGRRLNAVPDTNVPLT